jgi:hypothetical protein
MSATPVLNLYSTLAFWPSLNKMSNYYFAIVGATDNPIYETEIVPSSRSSAFIDSNRVMAFYFLFLQCYTSTNRVFY